MTAELLEDTAANIMAYINKWIAKKTKATRNAMILKVLNEMTKGKEDHSGEPRQSQGHFQ